MFSKFQCWRCDKVTSEGRKCSACGMAYYCTDRCRMNDEFRHNSSECQDVAVRYVCHGCHKKTTTKMKMCTNCMKVWFCDQKCQTKAWQSHKGECQEVSKATIQLGSELSKIKTFRMTLTGGMSQLYLWGNTPAIDLLNLSMNEGLHYTEPLSLLLCGVGDPRNVCFTISKLQDAEYQGKVTFVMNDICSCTLARTVLLLYLLCKGGVSKAGSVTQIWYSLYLSEEDHQFVVSGLRDLIQISNLEVITHGVMKMNADHFNRLKNVWKTWLHLSGENLNIFGQRRQSFDDDRQAAYGMASYIEEIPKKHQSSAQEWLRNGMLCRDQGRRNTVKENFTLMGSSQLDSYVGSYKYGVPTDSMPFNGWDYRIVRASYPDTDSLTEMYCNYITDVLRKCAARLQNDDIHLSFILSNCTDITPHLPEGMTYDRITMSNLWDYIQLRDLLQLMKPLLNPSNKCAVIVTETQNWIIHFSSLYSRKFGVFPSERMREKVLKDTGNKSIANSDGKQGFKDYLSFTEEFTSFVRASLLDPSQNSNWKKKSKIPSLARLADEFGLRPRDFSSRENKVAPFRWSLNCRRASLLQGSEISVEWTLI